jgi:hypothetical protein
VELEHVSRPPGPPASAQPLKNQIAFSMLETVAVPTLLLTGCRYVRAAARRRPY